MVYRWTHVLNGEYVCINVGACVSFENKNKTDKKKQIFGVLLLIGQGLLHLFRFSIIFYLIYF
jgi:hypothetical protein